MQTVVSQKDLDKDYSQPEAPGRRPVYLRSNVLGDAFPFPPAARTDRESPEVAKTITYVCSNKKIPSKFSI